jgi:hypothetical protein
MWLHRSDGFHPDFCPLAAHFSALSSCLIATLEGKTRPKAIILHEINGIKQRAKS